MIAQITPQAVIDELNALSERFEALCEENDINYVHGYVVPVELDGKDVVKKRRLVSFHRERYGADLPLASAGLCFRFYKELDHEAVIEYILSQCADSSTTFTA